MRARGEIASACKKLGDSRGKVPDSQVREGIQERDVKGDIATDDSAEATTDWVARIPARADCSETRFPPVGMELGVQRYGSRVRVAKGQGSTYARILTAPGAMGSQRLGAGAGKMRRRRRPSFVREQEH